MWMVHSAAHGLILAKNRDATGRLPLATMKESAGLFTAKAGGSLEKKKENRRLQAEAAVDLFVRRGLNQQLLQDEPQELGCMPVSTKPWFSWKSMLVFMSMERAFPSRKTFRPSSSMVVSPDSAALAMSIANEGLQPPGTTKIRTPSPAAPCFVTTSLNLPTALSVKLTILPP